MHRRRRERNSGGAVAVAILLIGAGLAASWLAVAPSVLAPELPALRGPLAQVEVESEAQALLPGVRAVASVQASQPRDPFRPLITEDAAVGTGGGTTAGDGGGSGGTDQNALQVRLVEIREVDGVLRATVEVNGTSYDVGVGDTFATNFKVVSLDEDSGVFLFGDNAFELSVGQQILK
ncbi:MAG: hypothetical protein ACRDVM_08025 [Acidimicrobiia bacterium]